MLTENFKIEVKVEYLHFWQRCWWVFFWNTAPYTFIHLGHNHEDRSNRFLRKDYKFLPDFTVSHPAKQNSLLFVFHSILVGSYLLTCLYFVKTHSLSPTFLVSL